MGIRVECKTEAKASIRLYNSIASYIFEQKYDEMKDNLKLEEALNTAQECLAKIINKSRKNG